MGPTDPKNPRPDWGALQVRIYVFKGPSEPGRVYHTCPEVKRQS